MYQFSQSLLYFQKVSSFPLLDLFYASSFDLGIWLFTETLKELWSELALVHGNHLEIIKQRENLHRQ